MFTLGERCKSRSERCACLKISDAGADLPQSRETPTTGREEKRRAHRSVSAACFGGANSPWFQPFPPVTPQEPRHPCSPPSAAPWLNPTASMRSSQNQTISFLLRLRYDGQGNLKPSRAPAWGVRASMDSSDNAESGRPSPLRFCRCCLRQMRKPRHFGSYHFRCSIVRPHAPLPALRLHPRGDVGARLAVEAVVSLSFLPDCTGCPAPVRSALLVLIAAESYVDCRSTCDSMPRRR